MHVLIAEDDAATAAFIIEGLTALHHTPSWVSTGEAALDSASAEAHDVIILDRLLPGIDGLDVLTRTRRRGIKTPILMLTALGQITDRVQGLEAGADDYLVKPFAFEELAARLNAIQRRRSFDELVLRHEGLVMDVARRTLTFRDRPIALQPREARILEELLRQAGRTVTRSMLLQRVWGYNFDPQTNLVETHLSRLRTKLGHAGAQDIIQTVRGVGYRLRPGS